VWEASSRGPTVTTGESQPPLHVHKLFLFTGLAGGTLWSAGSGREYIPRNPCKSFCWSWSADGRWFEHNTSATHTIHSFVCMKPLSAQLPHLSRVSITGMLTCECAPEFEVSSSPMVFALIFTHLHSPPPSRQAHSVLRKCRAVLTAPHRCLGGCILNINGRNGKSFDFIDRLHEMEQLKVGTRNVL
jgi:hypothetical protein